MLRYPANDNTIDRKSDLYIEYSGLMEAAILREVAARKNVP
jgi:hypothetical protein